MAAPTSRLALRLHRFLLELPPARFDAALERYRDAHGPPAEGYARRLLEARRAGRDVEAASAVLRLLDADPGLVGPDERLEIARLLLLEAPRRGRRAAFRIVLRADAPAAAPAARIAETLRRREALPDPAVVLAGRAWLLPGEATLAARMAEREIRLALAARVADFALQLRLLQRLARRRVPKARLVAYLELPSVRVAVRVLPPRRRPPMTPDAPPPDDRAFLAKLGDLELDSRFRAGEVSYPEYVLRNMEGFFDADERKELHRIAAMHGLELERLLMEIQVKGRTSDADLQKLVETLKTLQREGIPADVVAHHETPSGHIEITARSRRTLGCLPLVGVLALIALLALVPA